MGNKKIYTSKSEISIKVVLSNGNTVRVAFTPRTLGSSVYITEDAELQKAIESHKEFGMLFVCDESRSEAVSDDASKEATESQEGESKETDEAVQPAGPKTIAVSSIQEAKDYLSDKFGISRSSLKSREAVERAALENGVVFEGLSPKN